MPKKPKPPTTGEKIVQLWYGYSLMLQSIRDAQCTQTAKARDLVWRIDEAIRTDRRKEKKRSLAWIELYDNNEIGIIEMIEGVTSGENP